MATHQTHFRKTDRMADQHVRTGSLTKRLFEDGIAVSPLNGARSPTSPTLFDRPTIASLHFDAETRNTIDKSETTSVSSCSAQSESFENVSTTETDVETQCIGMPSFFPLRTPLAGSPRTPPMTGRNRVVDGVPIEAYPLPFDGNIGKKLCRDYILIERIGQGDFGTVWKAYHMLERRFYAVKQFNKKFRGETDRQRRLQEVYALSACTGMCPYIVQYYDSWTEGNTLFVKMEYCDGGSVRKALPIGRHTWSDNDLWELIYQIGMALYSLHVRNIVHLDVKMDNVYIKQDGTRRVFKLGDFGLVRFDSPEERTPCEYRCESSVDQVWKGTNDDEGDKRYLCSTYLSTNRFWKEADIYAFGLNLHELACGVAIPPCGEPADIIRVGTSAMAHVSQTLQDLIRLMCDANPSRRPTAHELVYTAAANCQSIKRENETVP